MKYLLINYDDELIYIELDMKNIALRQIVIENNLEKKIHISCREDCLSEGEIDINQLVEYNCRLIKKEEFEIIWNSSINNYKSDWNKMKYKYSIEEEIEGIVSFYYPQGVIIIGSDFFAICYNSEIGLINQKIKVKVKGYDELNMWLIVE